MVVQIFLEIWIKLLQLATKILPNWDLPPESYYYAGEGVKNIRNLNFIFPFDTLLGGLTAILGFEIIVLTTKIVSGFFRRKIDL